MPIGGIESLDIADIVRGLVQDLRDLRARKISVQEANARSKLAHEVLRGVNLVITAQKTFLGSLEALPNPDSKPRKSSPKTVDL